MKQITSLLILAFLNISIKTSAQQVSLWSETDVLKEGERIIANYILDSDPDSTKVYVIAGKNIKDVEFLKNDYISFEESEIGIGKRLFTRAGYSIRQNQVGQSVKGFSFGATIFLRNQSRTEKGLMKINKTSKGYTETNPNIKSSQRRKLSSQEKTNYYNDFKRFRYVSKIKYILEPYVGIDLDVSKFDEYYHEAWNDYYVQYNVSGSAEVGITYGSKTRFAQLALGIQYDPNPDMLIDKHNNKDIDYFLANLSCTFNRNTGV